MRKNLLFTISLAFICSFSFGQTTIYLEDFSNQEDQGATGPNIDLSLVDWTIDITNVTLSNADDYFKVTNGVFEGRDLDGPQNGGDDIGAVWTSPTIDLTGYSNIAISLDVSSSGTFEADDYVRASYSIDQGTPIQFGYVNDDFNPQEFSVSSLSGSSMVITFEMDNNVGTELLRVDNVKVEGTVIGGATQVNYSTSSTMLEEEISTITVCASISNESATTATTVDVALDNTSTASNGVDYNIIAFPATLTFPAGSADDQCLSITIIDDNEQEDDETIILDLTNPTGGNNAELGTEIQHIVTINANDVPVPPTSEIRINEADTNTPGNPDSAEFVELFGIPNYSLDGLVLVLYNGNGDVSYNAIDLDNFQLDGQGYFIIGGAGAPGNPETDFGGQNNQLQNGADAIALYVGDAGDFPDGTPITSLGLVDALVYGSGSADAGLAPLYLDGDPEEIIQVDENMNNDAENQSIQRGSWFVSTPTPRSSNVLPVKLISFVAQTKNNKNILFWQTASEINNDKFEIQRSSNAREFKTIGSVSGFGNSYSDKNYSFSDEDPLNGKNYYRLKQTDYDGRFEYSDIVSAENSKNRTNIYPTTTSNSITISIEKEELNSVTIFNEVGQIVKEMSISDLLTTIDISNLTNGFYYISVSSLSGIETKRIIKQ